MKKVLGNSKGTAVWIQLNKYIITLLITNHPKRSPLDKKNNRINNRIDRRHRIWVPVLPSENAWERLNLGSAKEAFPPLGLHQGRCPTVTGGKKGIEKNRAVVFFEKKEMAGERRYAELRVGVLPPPPAFLWHSSSKTATSREILRFWDRKTLT